VIVVPDQVDLSRIPLVVDSGLPFLPQLQAYMRGKLEQFNASLGAALAAIAQAHPDLKLITPNVYARFNDVLANLTNYGFTKADPDALTDPLLADKSFTGPGKDYLFWDSIHPTTKAHALIAQWFYEALPPPQSQPQLDIEVSGGAARLTFGALLQDQVYTLQSSTNLTGWTDVTTFNATNSVGHWTQSLGSNSQSFFRLKR
jgi:phospholipase/lecithinase/hemolysin